MLRRLPAILLLLVASQAQASDGESGLTTLLIQAGNLLLLIAVLVYFGRKPLLAFFQDRRSQIKGDLDDAAGLLRSAESRYDEWQRRLIALQADIETIRSDGRRRMEEESAVILADARAGAERIHRDATAAVEQELRRAKAELRAEAAGLATEMAERILREQLGDSDRERLMDDFITRVESHN